MSDFEKELLEDIEVNKKFINKNEDEEKLVNNTEIILYIFVVLGIIAFIIGACSNEEAPAIIGATIVVSSIINFKVLIPLFRVLANISRNLRELNNKKD